MPHFHVLMLEDDPIDVELVTTTLKNNQLDCSYTVVDNRSDFIAAMENERIDLVLADYSLPDFDGISAIVLVHSYDPDIPCILVSGVLGEERAIEALKSGATDYVLKGRLERLEPAFTRAIRERQERLQLKATAAALQASEERFRTSVETMVDCFIILNAKRRPDGEITDFIVSYLNTAVCKYLAISAHEQIGKPLHAVIPGFAEAIHNSLFYAFCFVIDSGQPFQEEIFLYPQKDIRSSSQPNSSVDIDHSNQQFVALEMKASKLGDSIVVTWRDITLRKQVEAQRLQLLRAAELARNQAETANHFKDEFIATLSHELRTPLNAINGWIQLVRKSQEKPEKVLQAFDIIHRNTAMLAQMINDILDVSRISQGKLALEISPITVADFNRIIANTLETLGPTATTKGVKIAFSPDDEVSKSLEHLNVHLNVQQPNTEQPNRSDLIAGDTQRLRQVVWNLLSNAIKFTPEGGSINITTHQKDKNLVFCVEDTGTGIDPAFLPRIFERFQQANTSSNRSANGLGLGLSIVQHVVESHGGQITAYSNGRNQGSLFKVSIPLKTHVEITHIQKLSSALSQTTELSRTQQALAAKVDQDKASPVPTSLINIRVLVVEDQPDALELYKQMLESHKAKVAIAASVAEALEKFHQFQPHVIISDIGLPVETGYDLIRAIRALPADQGGQTPAIALSAYTEIPYQTRALLAGFQRHVPKPVDIEQIAIDVYQLAQQSNL